MNKKKKNVFGLFVAIDPCTELSQICDWIEEGNLHNLTLSDWEKLERLVERCSMLGIEETMRVVAIMQQRDFNL
jgi:hypothetical protein